VIIHLGGNIGVLHKHIVAIIDIDCPCMPAATAELLNAARREGRLQYISEDKPKSCVLTNQKNKSVIFLSPITSRTLLQRVSYGEEVRRIKKAQRKEDSLHV